MHAREDLVYAVEKIKSFELATSQTRLLVDLTSGVASVKRSFTDLLVTST